MIIILISILYIVSNIQLIFIIYRFKKQDAWLILTTTPNRYLHSLLLLPIQISINLYCLKQLCMMLPEQHSLHPFLTPYLITLYSVSFSSLFTAIDYFNGNAGYTDLKHPYNISVIRARDAILEKMTSDTEWKCSSVQHVPVSIDEKTARKIARNTISDVSVLANYLKAINIRIKRLTDTRQWSLNLFNVFVFVGSVFWTIGCCILLYIFKIRGLSAGQPEQFETICNLQLVSVFIVVMWLQFRAYEFAEFADIGWRSHEHIDLLFAGLVIAACMIMIAIAKSSSDPIKYLGVLSLVIPMYNLRIRQHVREFCGSWMNILNLVVFVIIELIILGVLYIIMSTGRQ